MDVLTKTTNPAQRLALLEQLLGPQIETAEKKLAAEHAKERKRLLAERAAELAECDARCQQVSVELGRTRDEAARAQAAWQSARIAAATAENLWLAAELARERCGTAFDKRLDPLGGATIREALAWLVDVDTHLCARFAMVPTPPADGGWRWGRAPADGLREAIAAARAARAELPGLLHDETLDPAGIEQACIAAAQRVGAALGDDPQLIRSMPVFQVESDSLHARMTRAAVAAGTGRPGASLG